MKSNYSRFKIQVFYMSCEYCYKSLLNLSNRFCSDKCMKLSLDYCQRVHSSPGYCYICRKNICLECRIKGYCTDQCYLDYHYCKACHQYLDYRNNHLQMKCRQCRTDICGYCAYNNYCKLQCYKLHKKQLIHNLVEQLKPDDIITTTKLYESLFDLDTTD